MDFGQLVALAFMLDYTGEQVNAYLGRIASGEIDNIINIAAQSVAVAQTAAEAAKEYSGNPPKPDVETGTWWVWNAETKTYVDTGVKCTMTYLPYESVAEMEADKANRKENDLAFISSGVNSADNGKVYRFDGTKWNFLVNLSGSTGVGIASVAWTGGNHAPGTDDTYTITTTDGKEYTFQVHNGATGPQGPQGKPGLNGVAVAADGQYAFNVNSEGHLICSYTGTEAPAFHIDQSTGHLILTI